MLAIERASREGSRKGGGPLEVVSEAPSVVDADEEMEVDKEGEEEEEEEVIIMSTKDWAKGSGESASSSKGKKGKGDSNGRTWVLPAASCDVPLTKLTRGF